MSRIVSRSNVPRRRHQVSEKPRQILDS